MRSVCGKGVDEIVFFFRLINENQNCQNMPNENKIFLKKKWKHLGVTHGKRSGFELETFEKGIEYESGIYIYGFEYT